MRFSAGVVGTGAVCFSLLSACGPTESRTGASASAEQGATALAEAVMASMTIEGLERNARAIVQYERPSGSPGANAAIDSIVAALRAAGVPVEVHTFDTYASDPVSAEVRVPAVGLALRAITMAYSGSADGLRAPLVDVGGLGDLPELELGTGEIPTTVCWLPMPGSGPTWWHSVAPSSCPRSQQPRAMSPHPAHPPSPPLLRPRLRGSDGPSCSLASTTCCRCSVPLVAVR